VLDSCLRIRLNYEQEQSLLTILHPLIGVSGYSFSRSSICLASTFMQSLMIQVRIENVVAFSFLIREEVV